MLEWRIRVGITSINQSGAPGSAGVRGKFLPKPTGTSNVSMFAPKGVDLKKSRPPKRPLALLNNV